MWSRGQTILLSLEFRHFPGVSRLDRHFVEELLRLKTRSIFLLGYIRSPSIALNFILHDKKPKTRFGVTSQVCNRNGLSKAYYSGGSTSRLRERLLGCQVIWVYSVNSSSIGSPGRIF
jgi:hypothetical protein